MNRLLLLSSALLLTASAYSAEFHQSQIYTQEELKRIRPSEQPDRYQEPVFLPGEKEPVYLEEFVPWLTGPLLTSSAHTIPPGHFNIEPYLFAMDTTGAYGSNWHSFSKPDFWSINPQISLQAGVLSWMDVQATPQMFWNHVNDTSSTHFGDLPTAANFQLWRDTAENWYPAVKLSLKETFPTGKYQHLNPNKQGTDAVGGGSYVSGIGIVFSRLFHFKRHHFLSTRLSNTYNIPSPVHVKGFNSYGGAADTKGKVYPGNSITTLFGFEYTFNQRWVYAMDIMYVHSNKTRFSGHKGFAAPGIKASVGGPSSDQFSLAPALEYNWAPNLGLIAGSWFTIAGRNASRFVGGVIAFNYYY